MSINKIQQNSILLETDPIQAWLDTPFGYYTGVPFGFNPNLFLYKNKQTLSTSINRMLDDMERDLGTWVYEVIEAISIGTDSDIDESKLEIRYIGGYSITHTIEKG